ncbi:MAG: hypothetical protein KBC48_01350 [Candidatus Pacebacteria bacterium]|nr:hypothetical protein [Candidatus Paceibacterota bacterium]
MKIKVLDYRHPALVKRLVKKLGLTHEEAEEVFLGMKQFLFLCGTKSRKGALAPQSTLVDEAWHHFMLFSRDYHRFCFQYFGRLIHHQPTDEGQDDGAPCLNRTKEGLSQEFKTSFNPALASAVPSCIVVPAGDCSGTTNCQDE